MESTQKVRNKQEKIYYIYFYKDGKQYEESVGRQYRDDMTPARASVIRSSRINGNTLPNSEKRRERPPERKTLNYLWDIYKERKHMIKSIKNDGYRYEKYIREPLGDKTPEEITPNEIDLLKKKLLMKLKPQTVKHVLIQIKRVINFASDLASSGEVDLYTLQKLMGHKSPKMTQRYAHLRDETLKKASAVTDALRKKRKKKE